MAGEINRDRTIEHLLRQAQPVPFSAPTPDCLDPERLAAWQAGSLRTTDAAAVETHLADCGYCQTMLAGFVESEPAPAAAVPFWQRWNARWLVPATVAAAAVFVWVIVPREGAQPMETPASPTSTMARVERFEAPELPAERAPANESADSSTGPAAPPPATADARLRQETPSAPSAAEQRASVEQRDVAEKMTSSRAGAAVGAAAPQQAADDARVTAPFAASRPSAPAAAPPPPAQASVAAPAASPPPAPAPAATVLAEPPPLERPEPSVQVSAARPLSLAPTSAVISAGGAGRGTDAGSRNPGASNVMMDGVSSVDAPIAIHARVDRARPVAFSPPTQGTVAARRGAASAREFASVVRWRLNPDGRLERSFDEGRTWSAATIEGASFFTAGSAPLDGVCWLVDRDGGVWRSIGGGAFARASSIANAVPVAIQALDATRASVTTSDGRQFTTIDGGTTWRITP